MVEKKEGATMTCSKCKTELTCKTKHYKASDKYPEKTVLQWQNKDGSAHYSTNNGKDFTCNVPKDSTQQTSTESKSTVETAPSSDDYLKNKQKEIEEKLKILPSLDEKTANFVKKRTIQLYQINNLIRTTLEEFDPAPNPAMIGQFTNIIKDELKIYSVKIPDVVHDKRVCSCHKPIPNSITNGRTCQTCKKLTRNF